MFSTSGKPLAAPDAADAMALAVRHRGPDNSGRWQSFGAILGVERLRVVDPTERADQPFVNPDGNIWLGANGEIFNAPSLRARYRRYPFRSKSDVECILPAFLDNNLEALDGQFAVVLWHRESRTLTLARDRAGEKPLFFAMLPDEVVVASEIGALLAHPGISHQVDERAAAEFLRFGYVPEPRTMFVQLRQVPAGCVLTIDHSGLSVRRYWRPEKICELPVDDARAANDLDRLLIDSVLRQSSDVVPGVFLSGGVDSAVITAILSRHTEKRVPTFSVRFSDTAFDESPHARTVAKLFETGHTEIHATDEILCNSCDDLIKISAEPISDPAALPAMVLSKRAARSLKVVMSGEGADELFGGYPTYLGHRYAAVVAESNGARALLRALAATMKRSDNPVPVRSMVETFVTHAGLPWMDRHRRWFNPGGTPFGRQSFPIPDAEARRVAHLGHEGGPALFDYMTYLRDQLLAKVDRTSMANSLESRSPFLDTAVTRFALSLPPQLKVSGLTTKSLLKTVAERYLPGSIVHRRKHGFSVPVGRLLNGPLRQEADTLFAPERLNESRYLQATILREQLHAHRNGFADHGRALWTAFTFQRWHEQWVTGEQ